MCLSDVIIVIKPLHINTDDNPEEFFELKNEFDDEINENFIEELIRANEKSNVEPNNTQELEQEEAVLTETSHTRNADKIKSNNHSHNEVKVNK